VPGKVWLLMACNALMASTATLTVFCASLVGTRLAPSENLSTLPLAFMVIGVASAATPVAMLMQRFGRKKIFMANTMFAIAAAWLAALAIQAQSFALFCGAVALLGGSMAAVQQYRFAAMESVDPDLMPRAASQVLLGGLVAAFMGPELGVLGRYLLSGEYAGSFALLAVLYVISFGLLTGYRNTHIEVEKSDASGRPMREIMRQPVLWVAILGATVGYSVMTLIMTATPISMHVMDGHSLTNTKWVIQSHIAAMYLPSFVTPWLIRRIGIARLMLVGLVVMGVCLGTAWSGRALFNYWTALILLGIGWNFLFLGGTTLLPRAYEQSERFRVQALNEFTVFGAQALASLSAGLLIFGWGWHLILLAAVPLLGLQLATVMMWRFPREGTAQRT
jgi:MFS family permease